MTLTELYKSKSLSEKQELIDSIKLKIKNVRERAIISWLLGQRNPKPFAKKTIAKLLELDESELFPN